jgi:hypothetical protein
MPQLPEKSTSGQFSLDDAQPNGRSFPHPFAPTNGPELALPWHAQQIPSTPLIRFFACLRVGSQVAVCAISGRRWNCFDQVIE